MSTEQYQKKNGLAVFLSFFKPHRKLFILDLCCAFLVAAIDLMYPVASRHALNDLLPQYQYRAFFVVMGIVIAAYLLRAFLMYIVCVWGHLFGVRVEADIRQALFTHMQTLDFGFYDRNRTGHLMSRLTTDLFEIMELAHHGPEDLLISVITIIGAMIVLFRIEWRLSLVLALLIPAFLTLIIGRRRAMRKASQIVKQKQAAINSDIESSLSGMRTAKAFANEPLEHDKFSVSNEQFKYSKREFHRQMGIFNAIMELFVSVLSVSVIVVGGYLVMTKQMDLVDVLTFSLYVSVFVSPIRKLANFAEQFANGSAGFSRFLEIMRTQPEIQDAPDAVDLTDVQGAICVNNVSFAYRENLDVLHNVSLSVAPGQTVAIVGPSGGGKSTLCQLIPRFYEVSEGSVTIDGIDVRKVTQSSLHRSIGVVQQDVFLFADTVAENIRYGKPDATMDEIITAARRAEIYDDIMAMPDGFDTYVGERGTLLSGGQKQRISIARIFLKNPPILILDEATSALDSVTEAKIQRALDALAENRTTLIIAHRLSTIRSAKTVLVVCDGKIQEQGTHDELVKNNGLYAELLRTQNLLLR